ncbi:NAD(P)H-dependent glycerol-3-phosphate dehydrogenase [Persicobacter psychrovividus]|uniref:Glycerol-3-phosphate dehydrogenase [NAD(P)+] n=1 Tax=Persicobacter psychrovividus TaxID=387638 RepID=A0ABM7VEK3_9BACT|nr:glycerol-3-phosphate dehydrogenase [NAD(P)+] [Persicobacter psychrovividus]
MSKTNNSKPVGVIGSGSFGLAVANLLAENSDVLVFTRKEKVANTINQDRFYNNQTISDRITAINSYEQIANTCDIIFPVVPSVNFREMMRNLSPFLRPYHILIHGTKGLDLPTHILEDTEAKQAVTRANVKTMSEVIQEESVVVRTGCLAGPNLAKELSEKYPAATVVASYFDEVIQEGQRLLRSERFQVFGSKELIGIELAGILKNILAIASGAISGLGFGENARGLLISRGLVEFIYLGKMLGGNTEAFLGVAGVGDLVTTCTSKLSRNYTVGYRLSKGESLKEIMETMDEVAEGVKTVRIVKKLCEHYGVRAPITESIYRVLYEDETVELALRKLMKIPFHNDIDFL